MLTELAETRTARIVWTDRMDVEASDTFAVIDDVVDRIVSAIAGEIEMEECHRTLLVSPIIPVQDAPHAPMGSVADVGGAVSLAGGRCLFQQGRSQGERSLGGRV